MDRRISRRKIEKRIPLKPRVLIRIIDFIQSSVSGFVREDYTKSMPDILAIGFQEICDLTATNMVWQRYS
jgi:hypothetical protein